MPAELSERQATVLATIVRAYITAAAPVGSAEVRERAELAVSPATVRNDMAFLEEVGYLMSPHTSAGRVPTEKAYRYYVGNFLTVVTVPDSEAQELTAICEQYVKITERFKRAAKAVAGFSAEGVFLTFGRDEVYYTGLTNLFAQPEFREQQHLFAISRVIDQLDEAVDDIVALVAGSEPAVTVLVGSDNPFGPACSVILASYGTLPKEGGVFGILGPTRMDYDTNVARATYLREQVLTVDNAL